MQSIAPYLLFRGNCREVMQYYKQCIGGELDFVTYEKLPEEYQKLSGDYQKDHILHSSLSVNGKAVILASDCGQHMPSQTSDGNFAVAIEYSCEQTLRQQFELLSVGGEVKMPVEKQWWGDIYGWVTDKYGVNWMLSHKPESDSSAKQN